MKHKYTSAFPCKKFLRLLLSEEIIHQLLMPELSSISCNNVHVCIKKLKALLLDKAINCSQPLYLAHAQENASEASAKHAGMRVGFANEASKKKYLSRSPPRTQSSLTFALASSSLVILSARSTVE